MTAKRAPAKKAAPKKAARKKRIPKKGAEAGEPRKPPAPPKARPGRTLAGTTKKAAPKKAARRKTAPKSDQGTAPKSDQGQLFAPDPAIADILDERLLVPQKVAALAFGISVEALVKWKVKAKHKRGRESLYYLPELIRYKLERAHAAEGGYMADRARLARAQSEKTELEVAQLRRDLIPATEILENWGPLITAARQKILAIKSKIKTQIPALTDDDLKTVDLITRSCLEDLANARIPKPTR